MRDWSSKDMLSAKETAPGVRVLRELWDIPKSNASRQELGKPVSTDIYQTGSNGQHIPRRRRARSR